MDMSPRRRKGMVLLQTLVISVILSMIAVMVMKWVLGRYMLAARNFRSAEAKIHSQGYSGKQFAAWNFNLTSVASSGSTTMDSVYLVGFDTTGGSANMRRFVFTSDEDQY